jgi:hypothetical protein
MCEQALAHRRRDALDGLLAHVAGHEDAGHARLQPVGVALQRPAPGALAVPHQVGAGEDEAVVVALDDAGAPIGVGHGADEDEQGGGRHRLLALGLGIAYG